MSRNAHELPDDSVVDLVDDGLSDTEISARFTQWLADLDNVPPVTLPIGAINELRNAYAADDV